ncbi:MAG: amidohydrolase family protein [Verrucomicrobiae bacterium]|nr:amidohydrolase family protein [Verrucomicrobiae bacterium]
MKRSPFQALSPSPGFDRRSFLKSSAATLAAGALSLSRSLSVEEAKAPVIDTNVYLGQYPFRHLPLETSHENPESVVSFADAMSQHSMASWASSFEALLQRDYDGINERLVIMATADKSAARQFQLFGAVNPKVSGWQETLRRIHQVHRMRGIRLHPNFHGYTLDDPDFAALLDAAAQKDLIVQIAIRMEDIRTQHPAATVPDVDPTPLLDQLTKLPGLRLQLLNGMRSIADTILMARLSDLGVHFDIAMLEGMSGLARLMERVPEIKLCYGSYAPFFYPEAAALKLVESAPELDSRRLAAVSSHHAENLLMRG